VTGVVCRGCRVRGGSGRAAEKSWSPTILRAVTYDTGGGSPSKSGEELPPFWPLAAAPDAQRRTERKNASNAHEGQATAAKTDAATAARPFVRTIGDHPRWPAPKHVTVTQPGNSNQAVKERSSRSGHSATKKRRAPSPRKQDTHQRVRDSTHAVRKMDGGLSTTRRAGAWLPGDKCLELGERCGRDVRRQCNGRLSAGDWRRPHGNGRRGRREPARKETRMTKDGSLVTADSRGPFVLETQKCGPHNCLLKIAREENNITPRTR